MEPRTEHYGTRLTKGEKRAIAAAARRAKMRPADWGRAIMLANTGESGKALLARDVLAQRAPA